MIWTNDDALLNGPPAGTSYWDGMRKSLWKYFFVQKYINIYLAFIVCTIIRPSLQDR